MNAPDSQGQESHPVDGQGLRRSAGSKQCARTVRARRTSRRRQPSCGGMGRCIFFVVATGFVPIEASGDFITGWIQVGDRAEEFEDFQFGWLVSEFLEPADSELGDLLIRGALQRRVELTNAVLHHGETDFRHGN